MTDKRSALVFDYAHKDPANFANSLEHSSTNEITEILQQLPNEIAASVLARLPPQKAENLLMENSDTHIEWIADSSLEDAKAILIRLPSNRRKSMVRKLPRKSHRMQLMRFLNYPEHSLGRYVSDRIITVPVNMATAEVIDLIRSSAPGLPVIATNAEGQYVGLLNARRVLEGSVDVPLRSFVDTTSPLLAETSLADAMDANPWKFHSILAVIDHEGHVLGVISREALLKSLDISPNKSKPINSVLTVFQLYIKVMVKLSETIFKVRNRS